MDIHETGLPGLLSIIPRKFGDGRGSFSEVWNAKTWAAHGLDFEFVQDNQSVSEQIHTVRGLHMQTHPHAQGKLVRCAHGEILDVAVDIRVGSPSFGQHFSAKLTADGGEQLYVPVGFLHGFATLSAGAVVVYKTTAHYAPDCERAVHFADPDLGIDWGFDPALAVLSDKDGAAGSFAELGAQFEYEGSA